MKIEEVMVREVVMIDPESPVAEAAERMRALGVGSLPVVDNRGHPVGMITDRDIVTRCDAYGRDTFVASVGEVMSPHIISCHPDEDVETVARAMVTNHVRRLPVVGRADGRVTGIVSVDDLAECVDFQGLVGQLLHADSHAHLSGRSGTA
jgi:CBS domain-containing protein